jgi:predicted MFS family arabinose efflux permease
MGFGYFGIQGVIFNLYLLRLGFGPEFIGLLTGVGQLIWALCALPAAALGRRFGVRGTLIAGIALSGVANGLALLVENFPRSAWSYWLFGCWALLWASSALNSVNNIPYALGAFGPSMRTRIFPLQSAVMALMALFGSLVAGTGPGLIAGWTGDTLADPAPYRAMLWIVPALHAISSLLFATASPAAVVARQGDAVGTGVRPTGLLALLLAIVFLQTAGEGAVRAFFNVYLDADLGVAPQLIGALMGGAQLLPVAAALATPRLLARWGTPGTLGFGSLGVVAALVPLVAVPGLGIAAVSFAVVLAMAAVNNPSRNIFSQEIVGAPWRTTGSAVLTIGMALGWASSAAAGGFIITTVGFDGLFTLSATLAALAAILVLGYRRRQPASLAATSPTT